MRRREEKEELKESGRKYKKTNEEEQSKADEFEDTCTMRIIGVVMKTKI